ncbi:hypothetical protein BGZ61DRAFT_453594 [Ilyonectria robusta]|uniref:uncharacterized protein n=1 Tax=Ilyonectria robusta TaxID=1079257 RepID=UPI001E8DD59C|nr:uncharacterized protein BGZ61DRAFT_453594 [Ilyonectria robusta]KAH8686762.1 hypothetical protein BGZ61DRAFT_453594 [Ilyonectria robusta]
MAYRSTRESENKPSPPSWKSGSQLRIKLEVYQLFHRINWHTYHRHGLRLPALQRDQTHHLKKMY